MNRISIIGPSGGEYYDDPKFLKLEIMLLRKQLARYMWKPIDTAPKGRNVLIYMQGGTLIQGHGNTGMATHWMEKPPSPSKQQGQIK